MGTPSLHRNGYPVGHSLVISDPLARELGLLQVFSLISVSRSREHVYCVVLVSSPWEDIYYGGSILPVFLSEICSREHGSVPFPKDQGTGRCFLTVFVIPKSWVTDPGFHSLSTPSSWSLGLLLRSDLGGGCLMSNVAFRLATKGSGYCWPDQVEGDMGGPDLWILPSTPLCCRFAKSVDDLLTLSSIAAFITVVLGDAGKTSQVGAVSAAADTEAAADVAVGSIPVFRPL